jgi:hypothetical protein
MPKAAKSPISGGLPPADASLSPGETARYTRELLESLRKIAERQGQGVLAHLLALARYEAQSLAAADGTSKTMTPDSRDGGHSVPPAPVPAER